MAHIQKRNVRYQARYRDPGGKERTKTFDRKVDAEDFLHDVEVRKRTGEWVSPDRASTNFAEFAGRWLESKKALKPKTFAGYESLLRTRVLPHSGHLELRHIEPLAVDEWLAYMIEESLSASRIRQAHQVLHSVLNTAVRNRYLPTNPASGVTLPRLPQNEMRFLTIEQVEELRAAIQYPYGVLVAALAYGGIRWSEAAALRLRRVDILRSRLTIAEAVTQVGARFFWGVPKNHRHREIAIPAELRDDLNEHILAGLITEPEELIFTSPHGQTLRSSNFHRSIWKPALRAADIDSQLRIHDLRHTCAAVS